MMTTTTIITSRSILMIVAIMMMGAMTMTTTTDAFSSPLPTGSKKSIVIGGSRLLVTQPSTASSASISDTTASASASTIDDDSDDDEIWMALEQIAATHEEEKGRIVFHEKELVLQNEELATALSDRVNFRVPKTWEEADTVFWNQSQPQLLAFAALVSILFRFSLPSSFGVADLVAIGLTKAAWDVQEWSYHYRNFHGGSNNNGKAHFPFQYHDHHHDLPYYHVAMEPTSVCAVYALSVTLLATITYGILDHYFVGGAGGLLNNNAAQQQLPGVVVTTHATFLVSSIRYVWVHYLAHSKVPLEGELQEARMHHIQHHINHEVNLNMASHTIDQLVGTTTTAPTPSTKEQTSN